MSILSFKIQKFNSVEPFFEIDDISKKNLQRTRKNSKHFFFFVRFISRHTASISLSKSKKRKKIQSERTTRYTDPEMKKFAENSKGKRQRRLEIFFRSTHWRVWQTRHPFDELVQCHVAPGRNRPRVAADTSIFGCDELGKTCYRRLTKPSGKPRVRAMSRDEFHPTFTKCVLYRVRLVTKTV